MEILNLPLRYYFSPEGNLNMFWKFSVTGTVLQHNQDRFNLYKNNIHKEYMLCDASETITQVCQQLLIKARE